MCSDVRFGVKRVGFVMSAICPVYPEHQTFPGPVGTSHLGQEQTILGWLNGGTARGGQIGKIASSIGGDCSWPEADNLGLAVHYLPG
jgi:hypothetical protein